MIGLGPDECRALFDHWRAVVMGNLGAAEALPSSVGGYFHRYDGAATRSGHAPATTVPLGEVRRTLLSILERVDLSDDQRITVELYYGLHGLPLPFASASGPDIAGGRNESSSRAACRAALARIAPHVQPRPITPVPARTIRSPLVEHWFRSRLPTPEVRRAVLARAYVRAIAQCDGPYAGPTLVALERWYRDCGYADPDLLTPTRANSARADSGRPTRAESARADSGRPGRGRPNRNALARAGALMEIATHDELPTPASRPVTPPGAPPTPSAPPPKLDNLSGTVTHPDLVPLLHDEVTPQALMAAAHTLRTQALDGIDVGGQLTLLLRCLRPRVGHLSTSELERIAVSVSYVASVDANPFLALEWLGHFLGRVGVTDRTFTVLVNTSVAASRSGHLHLARRTDHLFRRLQRTWVIPPTDIPLVEHAEAEQQRLVAESLRLQHLGLRHRHTGAVAGASDALRASTALAMQSIGIAHVVLTDTSRFPARPAPGRAADHGGDLTWHWYLAAVLRFVESLTQLDQANADAGLATAETRHFIRHGARLASRYLADYDGTLDSARFEAWYGFIESGCARLVDA